LSEAWSELVRRLRGTAALGSVGELLAWDQETNMPPKAAAFRAEESALVARLAHERATDERVLELVVACESDVALVSDELVAADLREIRRDWERARRLPSDFVAEANETSSLALEAWKEARRTSDFAKFLPWLERQVEIAKRKAAYYGTPPGGEAYDALLEDYQPGITAAEVDALFSPLRQGLAPLIRELGESASAPPALGPIDLPVADQRRFHEHVLGQIGFDRDAGRLDTSVHPFSAGIAPADTRITTRFRDGDFLDSFGSTLHEAGHALYEQGLPKDAHFGLPRAQPAGLGVHESQSRLWENHVGRSAEFWRWAGPAAATHFGTALAGISAEAIHREVNRVEPGLIRVESDEATYNLHVMLRFDLERAMLRSDLAPRDLPGAWNERMREDLGVDVPDDRRGCLQDVHWSAGFIGYFPTYTLGNLLGAMIWNAVRRDVPDLSGRIARGEFRPLLDWLRREIHAHGRRWRFPDLVRRVTGGPLEPGPFLTYLREKLEPLYR
jgi:carboxypeptidase Taq